MPNYLTIVASHLAIPDSIAVRCSSCTIYCANCTSTGSYRNTLDWKYASLDDINVNPSVKLGRILGITLSDVSAYIARSLFYDKIFENIYPDNQHSALGIGHARPHYARDQEDVVNMASGLGYTNNECYMDEPSPICGSDTSPPLSNYKNKQVIAFADHGAPTSWSGTLSSSNVEWMDLPFMISKACSPNNLWRGEEDALGPMLLRKGAIGYSGGSGVTSSLPGVCSELDTKKCWTDLYCAGYGECISKVLPGSGTMMFVLQNNDISLGELYTKLATEDWINNQNSFKYYNKHLFLGDPVLIPRWI